MTDYEDYFGGLSREEYEAETQRHFEELEECCLTDKEIIEAVEHCCGNIDDDYDYCENKCPIRAMPECRGDDVRFCRQWLMADILALANSYKAKIEMLEKELDTETNHNERLYKKIDRLVVGAYNINKIKSEAIKAFAENNVCNMFNNLIKSAETNEQQQIVFLCKQRFVEMYMGVIKNLTHEPTKIEHNSLCETETYESR